jgi:hypothetical protein
MFVMDIIPHGLLFGVLLVVRYVLLPRVAWLRSACAGYEPYWWSSMEMERIGAYGGWVVVFL